MYLGIKPHFQLWRKYFFLVPQTRGEAVHEVGGATVWKIVGQGYPEGTPKEDLGFWTSEWFSCTRWLAKLAELSGTQSSGGPSEHLRYEVLVNGACMLLGADQADHLALLGMDSVMERGRAVRTLMEARLEEGLEPPPGQPGVQN
jgi:hypothetical protein